MNLDPCGSGSTALPLTNMLQVEEVREKRTTWTMSGWRQTLKDGTQIMRAEPIPPPTQKIVTEQVQEEKEPEDKAEEDKEEEEEEEEEKDDEGFDEKGDEAEDVVMDDGEAEGTDEVKKTKKTKKKKKMTEEETAGGKSTSGTISKVDTITLLAVFWSRSRWS